MARKKLLYLIIFVLLLLGKETKAFEVILLQPETFIEIDCSEDHNHFFVLKLTIVVKSKADVEIATQKLPELINACHLVASSITKYTNISTIKNALSEEFEEILTPTIFDRILLGERRYNA